MPIEIADNIVGILAQFEQVKVFVDAWDSQINEAASKSSVGKPSPRYERAIEMLAELREMLGE